MTNSQVSVLRVFWLETYYECLKSWRMPSYTVPTLAFPLGFYYLFGVVLAGSSGNNAAQYLLATFGVFAAMGPSMFGFGVGVAMEEEQGQLEMKRVAPMPISALVVAKLGTAMAFTAFVLLGLYGIAYFLGGVRLSATTWLSLATIHLLTTIPFGLIGLTLGLALKGQAALAVTNIVFMLLSVLGGLWIPIMVFPEVAQTFAMLLPSYHVGEIALHAVGINDSGFPFAHWLGVGVTVAIFSLAPWFFWRHKQSQ
ncbi:MAG: ABC transporter permease [Pseudomonadota bacterium]